MSQYTIGQLAKLFSLSRSALLYYHKQGLLAPSGRSGANYRLYTEADRTRLAKIVEYRAAGLPLEDIKKLLQPHAMSAQMGLLTEQLGRLNADIAALKHQQQMILQLLGHRCVHADRHWANKAQWCQLLAELGFSERDMLDWHAAFEQRLPEAHEAFLKSLHLSPKEIQDIRQRAREANQV